MTVQQRNEKPRPNPSKPQVFFFFFLIFKTELKIGPGFVQLL